MSTVERFEITMTGAAERLGVSPKTLKKWVTAGHIPCLRTPGGHRRFRASDLDAFIARSTTAAPT